MYPYFTFFNQQISAYGIMILLGYGLGLIVVILRAKAYNFSKNDTLIAYIFAGIGAFFGGKFFYIIQGLPEFIRLWKRTELSFLEYFNTAGLVFYGGLIGCILFILLYSVIFKIPFWGVLDILIPALPLTQGFGRIGCFLVGCCYGVPSPHGIMLNASPVAPHDVALLPIQLIESAGVFALFLIMMVYGSKHREPGKLFSLYLIVYGILRFVLEFFRYDAIRGSIGPLSVSQWFSIGATAVGIYFAWFYKKKSRKL